MSNPVITKTCCHCGENKETKDFSKNKGGKYGLSHDCVVCKRAADKKYYNSKKGQVRFKNYAQTETFKEYKQSKSYKEAHRRGSKKYSKRHPDRIKAHSFINVLISRGRIARPDSLKCSHCESMAKHYHHYLGYREINWGNVIPVCLSCHRLLHKNVLPILI